MEKRDDFYIPEEMVEWIGLKKSEYLSKLIDKQVAGDIGFEEFHLYDSFVPETIERPDKTFESKDDEETIRTYIKSYSEKTGFHQVVIGVMVTIEKSRDHVFVPILSFVSKNGALIREFSVGDVISRPTLN